MGKIDIVGKMFLNVDFWRIIARDVLNIEEKELDTDLHLQECIKWLKESFYQTDKKGFAISYFPKIGKKWSVGFVETTGYIIETMLRYGQKYNDNESIQIALAATDWLISMQNENGSFKSNKGHFSYFRDEPYIFDTGQDIFGLVEAYRYTKDEKYKISAIKAGDWLCDVQSKDGSWVKYTFQNEARTYYIRVAWALLELFSITKDEKYKKFALNNYYWAIDNNIANQNFISNTSFSSGSRQFLHLIGYVCRSLIEGYRITNDEKIKKEAFRLLEMIYKEFQYKGRFAGDYDENFKGDYSYRCLTGEAQIANAIFVLFTITKDSKYKDIIKQINNNLKEVHIISDDSEIGIKGGLKGSHPYWKYYESLKYPNWAVKFFADSLMNEME